MTRNVSIRRFRLSWFGLGLLFATPVFAHDTLPSNWCLDPNTVPTVVAHFDFSPETLTAYRKRNPVLKHPPVDLPCNDERSCGIVDDWFWSDQLSQEFCATAALRSSTRQASQSMPLVHQPEAFNAREHHKLYDFRSGHLKGACVICVAQTAPAPVSPSPEASE
ncbi:MAG: hypothetical protein J0M09_07820 [Xanthomonadales bacterium]|nr:hypothetical protein [Xanthomonadales bacterium]